MLGRRTFQPRVTADHAALVAAVPFVRIIERPTSATHCFSVCLYHEPTYAARFPGRDFKVRYLDTMPAVKEIFARQNFALRIFCDRAMRETSLSFGIGSVYEVTEPPAFAFAQHLWRYCSVLLPPHRTIRAHHFRGLDNLAVTDTEIRLLDQFLSSGSDILHMPYLRIRGRAYTPVRGSCSVAHQGIRSLAHQLHTVPNASAGEWPADWHNDEIWLSAWFDAVKHTSKLFTVVDRALPPAFYEDLKRQIASGQPLHVVRIPRGPMTSVK